MKLRYNYRLYPDPPQRESLARLFGCVRAVWNDALARRKVAWKADRARISGPELQHLCITAAKRTPERDWLAQVSPVPLQQALRDLDVAYQNFFDSVSGKRKGPKVGLPVFKSRRDHRQSARFTSTAFRLRPGGGQGAEGVLYLAKIGEIEVRWSRELPAPPSSVMVVKDAAGRYFASFVVDVSDDGQTLPHCAAETGIDLGLTHYAVTSDGEKIAIGRWFPSSQLCPCCGHRIGKLALDVRAWDCPPAASTTTATSPQPSTSWPKASARRPRTT